AVAGPERVGRQVIVVLDEGADAGADLVVERAITAQRGRADVRCDAVACRDDVLERDGPGHAATLRGTVVLVEVFFLMMGLWLVVAIALGVRRPRGFGGAALRARLDAVYGEPHELARVTPDAFPEADLEFYDRTRVQLEDKGYTCLGDVEDLTLSRIYPQNRTFMRVFVDAGRMIRASAYHLHPRGVVVSLLQLVHPFPRHVRVLELVSEVQGQFLVTANTHGIDRLEPPPEAKVERLP